ncbi:MAG: CapA family protein [Parcubacteria group bacterium]
MARDPIRISLCGDVMLGRGVDQILAHPSDPALFEEAITSALKYVDLAERANGRIPRPVGDDYVWGEALRIWRERPPHARIVNLETAVTTGRHPCPKGVNYRMHPDNVGCLKAAGIDCCVLANNHILDWGMEGLRETVATLRKAGIATAGVGERRDEAREPATIDLADGNRVLVYAMACSSAGVPLNWAATYADAGVNFVELYDSFVDRITEQIARERQPGDVVIASIHWGGNWGYDVPTGHRDTAHALIDLAGVDLVYGHSSHHPLAVEVHNGRPILYGCGDFITDYEGIAGHAEFRSDLVALYLVSLDPDTHRLTDLELVPFHIRKMRLEQPSAEDRAWLAARLAREYAPFGLGLDDTGGTFRVVEKVTA